MTALAPYAVHPTASRGRKHADPFAPANESPFELDRYRILNCMAFRRLRYKTQVFLTDCGDHFRTRLTHTLEVELQAQRLSRGLGLDERLAGAIALAHDLGHPPFGHAGETALAALMKDHGGFEHNLQSLRVVDYLEHPYPAFRGLNLSFELRESLLKHRTRYDRPSASVDADIADLISDGPQAPLEGQAANLADTIAYTLHDIEDGLVETILTEDTLDASPLWQQAASEIRAQYPGSIHGIRRPIIDRLAANIIDDAVTTSLSNLRAAGTKDVAAIRRHPTDLVTFSPAMQEAISHLQALLAKALYRNHRVIRMDSKARRIVTELFEAFLKEPDLMPARFAERVPKQGVHRVIADYIAGMTDRFAQEEHRRLFAPFHFG